MERIFREPLAPGYCRWLPAIFFLVMQDMKDIPTLHWLGSTGRPCCFGYTPGGDFIIVVYEQVDAETIYPVTAYEVWEQ